MPSRRALFLVALLPLAAACGGSPAYYGGGPVPQSGPFIGCLAAGGFADIDLSGIPSIRPWFPENPYLGEGADNFVAATMLSTQRTFGVWPSVAYYDDSGAPNAFATSVNSLGSGDGSVRLGITLMRSEVLQWHRARRGQGAPLTVTAILAHEMAHILQVKRGAALPSRNTELQADFLAGWYFAVFREEDPDYFESFGALHDGIYAFVSRGDYLFNSPSHHGTPEQRRDAFFAGFRLGPVSLDRAWQESMRYRAALGG